MRSDNIVESNDADGDKILNLLRSQVYSVQNPKNLNDIYTFPYVDELTETLILFLKYPCHESTLERLGTKVLEALAVFAGNTIDMAKVAGALEDLATGFESYLKKIALFRYENDVTRLYGDGKVYRGLLQTTLGPLLEGKVAKVDKDNKSIPLLRAPIVTFTYHQRNIRETIYDQVRELRNGIHEASQKSYLDLFHLFQITVAGYLFALEENLSLVRQKVDPLFSYLAKIEKEFEGLDQKYIELIGEERKPILESWPDLQVFEWKDETDDLSEESLPWEKLVEDVEPDWNQVKFASQHSVIDLSNTQSRFWLIGEPGAGKTTTLRRIAWLRARELLNSMYLAKPCPVMIRANQYDKSYTFRKMISDLVKISQSEVNELLRKGKLWLLIDGWNEIALSEQDDAFRDLQQILNEFDQLSVVLTSRKYSFKHLFDVPVFELLPLSEPLIQQYLERNMTTPEQGKTLYEQLKNTKNLLLDLASNPLMLRMLIRVSRNGVVPANRGKLLNLFIGWFFNREGKIPNQTQIHLKENILTAIAFKMRKKGKISATQNLVFTIIRQVCTKWNANVGFIDIFDELLNNGILEVNANRKITFFHELILEYFASLELLNIYNTNKLLIQNYCNQVIWFESLIMLAGLLDDANDLVSIILQKDIALAARCVASGANVTPPVISNILKAAENVLSQDSDYKIKVTAITALLELATKDSFSLILRHLPDNNKSILTSALYECERPEISALGFLNTELKNKDVIYRCLKIFEGRLISPTILDTPQIAQAELALLSGNVNHQHLTLIDTIGISKSIRQEFLDTLRKVIDMEPMDTPIWRASMTVAVHQNFMEQLAERIKDRILQVQHVNISICYPIFTACQALRHLPLSQDIIIYSAQSCLKSRQYAMAAKYIKQFDLQHILSDQEVVEYIQDMAEEGKIGAMSEFLNVYPNIDIYPFLSILIDKQLERENLEVLVQYRELLSPIFPEKSDVLRVIVLKKIIYDNTRIKTIKNYIKVFNLEKFF